MAFPPSLEQTSTVLLLIHRTSTLHYQTSTFYPLLYQTSTNALRKFNLYQTSTKPLPNLYL